MSTIPIEVSTEQLLQAVERLPAAELDAFVVRVNALRTQRAAPSLSVDETALLLIINRSALDQAQQARFEALVARRQAEVITDAELKELTQLSDAAEQHDNERLAALLELARLRGTTVMALMQSLGIKAPTYG